MNKAQLIDHIAERSKLPKAACKKALEAFVDAVKKTLKKGDSVVITGFGTFSVGKRQARKGVHPITKKPMQIAAKKTPKFKAGKDLRTVVA